MKTNAMTRRSFLQGAGGCLVAMPFLGLSNQAFAQTVAQNRRMISLTMMSGTARPVWFPQVDASDMNLTGPEYKAARLSNLISKYGQISPILSDSRWANFANKLNLYDGLDGNYFTGHTRTGMLSGENIGDRKTRIPPKYPSIDYLVSQKIYAGTPAQRLLSLGARNGHYWGGATPSFSDKQGVIAEIPPILNPIIAFDTIFKDFVPPSSSGGNSTPTLSEVRAKRKSILDFVLEDFNRNISSTKLSQSEKLKLENHADGIRDLERRVASLPDMPTLACTPPSAPNYGMFESSQDNILRNDSFRDGDDLSLVLDLMADMIVIAIKCGMTQVATLQLDAGNSALGFLNGVSTDNHDLSHDKDGVGAGADAAREQVRIIQNFYMGKVLDIAEKLDVVEDASSGKTYLDNTLIVGVNEMGCWNHRPWSTQTYTISGFDNINSGHYIDYRTNNLIQPNYVSGETDASVEYHGRDYNSFLIGVMRAMGLNPSDWERNNVAGYGAYNFHKDWYQENGSGLGIITPGRRSAVPFMLT